MEQINWMPLVQCDFCATKDNKICWKWDIDKTFFWFRYNDSNEWLYTLANHDIKT